MFQPGRTRRPLVIGGVVAGGVVVLILLLLLLRHGSSGSGPDSAPATTVMHGSFTKYTMKCPPDDKEIRGDTCLITLQLPAGRAHIVTTWTGPGLLAMGVRNPAIKDPVKQDLGPQTTGEKGKDTFDTPAVAAGTYELRVVNVSRLGAVDFTVTVTSS